MIGEESNDCMIPFQAKEKQTSSITRFFKTIPKSAVPCNSDSITNDDAGEKTAKIKGSEFLHSVVCN